MAKRKETPVTARATREKGRDAALAIVILLCVVITTQVWVNRRQPAPYMDELYHVPQAAIFCAGSTTYSKHITTPPGPYILSALISPLTGCSVRALRLHSGLVTIIVLPLLAHITNSYRLALVIATHPPMLFFSTFYYTDTFGLVALLACWALARRNRHLLAASIGIVAAACRQTYAAWHAFIAALSLLSAFRRGQRLIPVIIPHAIAGILYVALFVANGYRIAIGDQANHTARFHAAQLCYYVAYRAVFAAPLFLTHLFSNPSPRLFVISIATLFAALFAALAVAQTGDTTHPFVLSDNRHFVFYLYRRVLLRGALVRYALVPIYAVAAILPFAYQNYNSRSEPKKEERASRLSWVTQTLYQWVSSETAVYNLPQLGTLATVALTVVPAPLLEPRYFIPGFVVSLALFLQRWRYRFNRNLCAIAVLYNLAIHFVFVFIFAELPFNRPSDIHMPMDRSPGRFML